MQPCPVCDGTGTVWRALVCAGEPRWNERRIVTCPVCVLADLVN